jgi:hypothetical protein
MLRQKSGNLRALVKNYNKEQDFYCSGKIYSSSGPSPLYQAIKKRVNPFKKRDPLLKKKTFGLKDT